MAVPKIKTRAPRTRDPLFADEKYTGAEPEWDTEAAMKYDAATYDHVLRKSFFYYNYFYTQKSSRKHVDEWVKNSGHYTKEQHRAFSDVRDGDIPMQACALIMASKAGMPWRERELEYTKGIVTKLINEQLALAKLTPTTDTAEIKATPNIQERMQEKTSELIGELEGFYDSVAINKPESIDVYKFLTDNKVPQSQLSKYEAVYQSRRTELQLAQSKEDEQLREGYAKYKAADFKRVITWIDQLLKSIDQYRGVKQAVKRTRVPRAPSKDKLVSKLKYAKTDTELKLVSINPQSIIGATQLWVYNTKTRKLGCYIGDSLTGPLSVKGTKIVNYDEVRSIQKTIRKPAETLGEFNKAGKIALRKFMDGIKTTDTKLNGSINEDVILLKVV